MRYKSKKRTYQDDFDEYDKDLVNDYGDYNDYENDEDDDDYNDDKINDNTDDDRFYYVRKKDIKTKTAPTTKTTAGQMWLKVILTK